MAKRAGAQLNPNALLPNPTNETLRLAIRTVWAVAEERTSTQTLDYQMEHIHRETVAMSNTVSKTVTLDDNPLNGQKVTIHRNNAVVIIDGNGKSIACPGGDVSTLTILMQSETYDLEYIDIFNNGDGSGLDKWILS